MRKYEIAVLSKGSFARTVRIYSPRSADRAVIMHDGQNAFDDAEATYGKSWRMTEELKSLGIKNVAVIAVDSAPSREYDYLPFPTELEQYGIQKSGGRADAYADYLESIVVPYLDKRFGYKFYGMLGSSFGALATLYFASKKNARFNAYGMFSAPLFVSENAFDAFFKDAEFDADAYYQIYTGGSEKVYETEYAELTRDLFVSSAFKLTSALRDKGIKNLSLSLDNLGKHDETYWRAPAREFLRAFSKL